DEVRDLLAVLALAAEGDGRALLRAVRLTGHSVDRAACTALITYARAQDARFPRALTLAAAAGLGRDAVAACTTLAAAIDAAGVYRSAGDFLARFLFGPVSPLRELLADPRPRAAARVMAIAGLLTLARSFQELSTATVPTADSAGETAEARPLREFLIHARRLYATREVPGRTPAGGDALDAVRVLTVHASKGLEFPVVYVPGLAAGRFPFREMWDACPPPPGLVAGAGEGDHDLEELCLFFVALSRARDELVLSVAGRYGKQAAKPSPFLAHLEPAFTATPPARLQWTAPAETDTPTPLLPLDDGDTTLDIAELEQYMRCPRQYEYTYRLYRESGDAGSGYRQFHHVVQGLVGRLREDQAAGALPSTEAAVLERLRAAWEAEGPGDHPHAELYADAARRVVMNTWQRLRDSPAVTPWQGEIHLPLGGARVRARLDLAQQQPDGSVRVVRTRLGKPRDEDRTAPRLALVQAAARAHLGADVPLTLALEYLDGGETVDVEIKPRYVQERLARLEKAVLGIRAGDFPAAPAAADECLRCPFWIICPT
ncbi:MAG TPA: PD-(D/E)XK nuclease family protein, partial [Chloroflexia bacterium]|nr:PD-(D/E)XK nuclease family protein [Chloroflexia bacterium]